MSAPNRMLRDFDPRHSLAGGIIWLMVALAASFAIAASVWAGSVAREIVVQQHVRRLALETHQLASDLGQAIGARIEAVRSSGALPPDQLFAHLKSSYPGLGWIGVTDATGAIVAGNASIGTDKGAKAKPWLSQGASGLWIGLIEESTVKGSAPFFGDMSVPLKDTSGQPSGVIAAHLTWPWAAALDSHGTAQSLILNDAGMVAVGPAWLRDTVWKGVRIEETPPESDSAHFERLPSKDIVLVIRAPVKIMGAANPRGWSVQLSEPREFVYQRANALLPFSP